MSEAVTLQHRSRARKSTAPVPVIHQAPPVASQWLGPWLNEILGKTGVEMSLFKAHSIRGASGMAFCLLTRIIVLSIHAYKQDLVHGRPVWPASIKLLAVPDGFIHYL